MKRMYEVYWTDKAGEDRGAKFEFSAGAVGFIQGLRQDKRNTNIEGLDLNDNKTFNCDEFGEPLADA